MLIPVGIGVPGNVLIVMVTTRKHNRHVSACVYMTGMAIVDTVVLLNSMIFHLLVYYNLVDVDYVPNAELWFRYVHLHCKISLGEHASVMTH